MSNSTNALANSSQRGSLKTRKIFALSQISRPGLLDFQWNPTRPGLEIQDKAIFFGMIKKVALSQHCATVRLQNKLFSIELSSGIQDKAEICFSQKLKLKNFSRGSQAHSREPQHIAWGLSSSRAPRVLWGCTPGAARNTVEGTPRGMVCCASWATCAAPGGAASTRRIGLPCIASAEHCPESIAGL